MCPLYVDRVEKALKSKREHFGADQEKQAGSFEYVRRALERFEGMSAAAVEDAIAAYALERPGARPTAEQDAQPLIVPFNGHEADWLHHREARQWALDVLRGVTTFAADGSAIEPRGDMNVKVGLVQVGWFENPHDPAKDYIKDVYVEVVSPVEFDQNSLTMDMEVHWRRYQAETDRAIAFCQAHAGEAAVCFSDGTLTISFVASIPDPDVQQRYRDCVLDLVRVSEKTGVPVIGYVDASNAVDLVTLALCLKEQHKLEPQAVRKFGINDAGLLRKRMQWGDRSRAFICDRDDGLAADDGGAPLNAYYREVAFTYLKTGRDDPPARLEIPRWVLEEGPDYFEWVLDVVRAECVVGVGYPYPLETADATAVLTMEDRERFYRMFHEFAEREGVPVRFSRKAISKKRRR